MKKAVALNDARISNPTLLARGYGEIARAIILRAREFNIPIFENEALAEALVREEAGSEIKEELFSALVEVFMWLYEIEGSAQASK